MKREKRRKSVYEWSLEGMRQLAVDTAIKRVATVGMDADPWNAGSYSD